MNGHVLTFKWDFDTVKVSANASAAAQRGGSGGGSTGAGGGTFPPVPAHGPYPPKKPIASWISSPGRNFTAPAA